MSRRFLARLLLVSCSIGGLLQGCSRRPHPALAEGDFLFAEGRLNEARVRYLEVLQTGPNAEAYRGVALCYQAVGASRLALEAFEATLDGLPADTIALLGAAQSHSRLGNFLKVVEPLKALVAQQPRHLHGLGLLLIHASNADDLKLATELLDAYVFPQTKGREEPSKLAHQLLANGLARLGHAERARTVVNSSGFAPDGDLDLAVSLSRAALERRLNSLALKLVNGLVEPRASEKDAWHLVARAHLNQGDYAQAESAVAHLHPQPVTMEDRWLTTRLELAAGFESRAAARLEEQLRDMPSGFERRRRRLEAARSWSDRGDVRAALATLSPLLELEDSQLQASLLTARLFLEQSQAEKGLQVLKNLGAAAQAFSEFHELQGRLSLLAGRDQAALSSLRQLVARAPHRPLSRVFHAQALRKVGLTQEAKEVLTTNLRLFPTHTRTLHMLAPLLKSVDGFQSARRFLESHGGRMADSAPIAAEIGNWLVSQRRAQSAQGWFRKALTLKPNLIPALVGVYNGYVAAGRLDLAEAALVGSLQTTPVPLELRLTAARLYSRLCQTDQARNVIQAGLDAIPEQPELLSELGILIAEKQQDLNGGTALVERALLAAPNSATVLSARGWLQHLQGAHAEANETLMRASEKSPQAAAIWTRRATVLQAMGKRRKAAEALQTARQIDPLADETPSRTCEN